MRMRLLIAAIVGGSLFAPEHTIGQSIVSTEPSGGFNVNLYVTAGKPFFSGGADEVWDAVGGLGIAPGAGMRLGYRWQHVGVEGGFNLAASNASGRDGLVGGIDLMVLYRLAPEHRFDPTVAVGFVREGLLADFEAGEFPLGTIAPNPDEYPDISTRAGTFGNGIRLDAGGNVRLSRAFHVTINAMADLVWFGTAAYNDEEYSLRESEMGVWPRLAVGLRWDP